MATPDHEFERFVADAAEHTRAGRAGEAATAYRAALQLRPGHPGVLHNLGVLVAKTGDQRQALQYFDAALAVEPLYASAHYSRAAALEALGERSQAIAGFTRTLALDPQNYESHRALAFLLLSEGKRGHAMDHFARTYDLRRGEDRAGGAVKSLKNANRTKLTHDAEQFRYLAQRKRDAKRFEMLAKVYETTAPRFSEAVEALSGSDLDILGETYNTGILIADAPEIADGVVSTRSDGDAIVAQFKKTGATFFDGLLTPRAFEMFSRYLLESTVWHDFSHIGGFVAAYLEDGLACPLLLQIVGELRRTFPELLADKPLSQAWAFKAVTPDAAVDVHADDAAISVNFWMTPTEANLNPDRGGMRVCLTPPPAEWVIGGYETDQSRTVPFLEQHRRNTLFVPYQANRAVLFESRLIHASDAPVFHKGYVNHRINVSLLFGGVRAP